MTLPNWPLAYVFFGVGGAILVGAQAIPAYAFFKWHRARRTQKAELAAQRAANLAGALRVFANNVRSREVRGDKESMEQFWEQNWPQIQKALGPAACEFRRAPSLDLIEETATALDNFVEQLRA